MASHTRRCRCGFRLSRICSWLSVCCSVIESMLSLLSKASCAIAPSRCTPIASYSCLSYLASRGSHSPCFVSSKIESPRRSCSPPPITMVASSVNSLSAVSCFLDPRTLCTFDAELCLQCRPMESTASLCKCCLKNLS